MELVHTHKAGQEEDNEHHQEEKEEQHITRALGTPEGVLRHAVFRVYMLFLGSRVVLGLLVHLLEVFLGLGVLLHGAAADEPERTWELKGLHRA